MEHRMNPNEFLKTYLTHFTTVEAGQVKQHILDGKLSLLND